ncbi:Dynein heavy chain [Glycine soja]
MVKTYTMREFPERFAKDRMRGLHVLAFRGPHAFTLRGLHVLAFRGLHALAFRGLHALAFRGLHVLAFRGLHALAFRGLHVLAFKGLHALAIRGLHILAFRGLHVLAFRGLNILAFKGLHILTFRGLHALAFKGLHILALRRLHTLAFRGLHVLALKGLHVLAFRGLHAVTFRELHALAFVGLHALTFKGLHVLAFRGLHALAFRGLHVLAFKGRHTLAFIGLHALAFIGLHICAFRELKWFAFISPLVTPLISKEGQLCEHNQREAIVQPLCILGQDFSRAATKRRVRIMRTSMTTLTQIWMTLLLSNILPCDHNADLPLRKFQLVSMHMAQLIFDAIHYLHGSRPQDTQWTRMSPIGPWGFQLWLLASVSPTRCPSPLARSCHRDIGIAPARHPMDPEKSNRILGFPALITGLCQFYGVPVAHNKVIRPPTNRAFIKKYCAPRQAQDETPQHPGDGRQGATDAPSPSPKPLSSSTKAGVLPMTRAQPEGDQVQSQRSVIDKSSCVQLKTLKKRY